VALPAGPCSFAPTSLSNPKMARPYVQDCSFKVLSPLITEQPRALHPDAVTPPIQRKRNHHGILNRGLIPRWAIVLRRARPPASFERLDLKVNSLDEITYRLSTAFSFYCLFAQTHLCWCRWSCRTCCLDYNGTFQLPFARLLLVWILIVVHGILLECHFAAVALSGLLAGPSPNQE
jgi:hypothetical protein